MRGRICVSLLAAVLTLGAASAALAQGPGGDEGNQDDDVVIADQRIAAPRLDQLPTSLDDEIVIACLRLPTLGDLSKERWNQVHRRYDSGRGRREKIRA